MASAYYITSPYGVTRERLLENPFYKNKADALEVGVKWGREILEGEITQQDRKSTRLTSHSQISYAVFCLKKKITEAAMEECERFYPVFQFVLWGGKSPGEAIAAALIDTHGEA